MARRCCWTRCLSLLVYALLPADARCGAPFQTDDPNTTPAGRIELLMFYQSTLTRAARTGTLPGLESHFGVSGNAELDVTAPVAFSTPSGSRTTRGYGDTTLGLKYRLVPESGLLPLVSLVPKVNFPTGNSGRGLGNGGSQVFLAVSAGKSRGELQTYGTVGYWINNGANNRNFSFFGWAAQRQLSARWIVGSEVFFTTAQTVGQSASAGFNLGGYYVFDERNQLLFSAGRGLKNVSGTDRASAYVGYQTSF